MKPYRLKHLPTGLYFQPYRWLQGHFSKRGKVYFTEANGLHDARNGLFRVRVHSSSGAYKMTKDMLIYQACTWHSTEYETTTKVEDWIKEEL